MMARKVGLQRHSENSLERSLIGFLISNWHLLRRSYYWAYNVLCKDVLVAWWLNQLPGARLGKSIDHHPHVVVALMVNSIAMGIWWEGYRLNIRYMAQYGGEEGSGMNMAWYDWCLVR